MTAIVIGQIINHTKAAHAGPIVAYMINGKTHVNDADSGGMRLSGTVTVLDVPASRMVRLLDHRNARVVRETWSDPETGIYTFSRIRDGVYTALAYDHTGGYDPEAKTNLTPEPM